MPLSKADSNPAVPRTALSNEALLSLDSMEGVYESPVVVRGGAQAAAVSPARSFADRWLILLVAAAAYAIHYLPFPPFQIASEHGLRRPFSAAILAILLGIAAHAFGWVTPLVLDDCRRTVKRLMPPLIVLTGAGLNLSQIGAIGGEALLITVACIAAAFGASLLFGRLFGVRPKMAMLIGAGTAICGTSAIIATAPVIHAEDEDVAISVGAVNLLGLALMICFPLLGGLLQLPQEVFGVWAGTSIHAVPQVVTAAFAFGEDAGSLATLVKLVRVTLLAPFLIALVLIYSENKGEGGKRFHLRLSKMIPSFLWGFLLLAVLTTVQLIPTLHFQLAGWAPESVQAFQIPLAGVLVDGGNIMLTVVMAAMGMEASLRTMLAAGRPALLTGLAACIALSAFSLALIKLWL
ncbi:MAG: YeiH family protein [Bryobacteraceae bacterium]